MTKYADKRAGTRYSLIAGFAEVSETIEETVRREMMDHFKNRKEALGL